LLSNRSAAYAKAGKWKEALEDADSCLSLNEKFDKGMAALVAFRNCRILVCTCFYTCFPGYARKAGALMGMGNNKEAMKVCQVWPKLCFITEQFIVFILFCGIFKLGFNEVL
jgi:hypothetical protein